MTGASGEDEGKGAGEDEDDGTAGADVDADAAFDTITVEDETPLPPGFMVAATVFSSVTAGFIVVAIVVFLLEPPVKFGLRFGSSL